jgi:hypothetical protein
MTTSNQHTIKKQTTEERNPRRRMSAVRALSMVGTLTLATGGLMTASSLVISPANADPVLCGVPTGTGLQQNLNTTLGCDVIEGTSLMSGYIADNGLSPNQQVTLEDAYEGLSSHIFYWGNYTLGLVCQSGTPSTQTANYVIAENTGSFPLTPPTVTGGALPVVTADSKGTFVCAYTLSVENAPTGHLNSSKSDLWIVAGGSGNTATTSVKPPTLDPSNPTTTTTPPTTVDPGSTSTTTPPTTVDPGSTSTTTPPTTVDPGNTSTTAPGLQTATVSDPTNGPTHVYDPVVTDPGTTGSSVAGGSTSTADPAAPTFNPQGLSALAFTGSNTTELAAIGLMLILFGGLVLGVSRRWVRTRSR